MIVNYNDFICVKDEGFIALAYVREGSEPKILRRLHLGDSLADFVADAWTHNDAPAEVVKKVSDK